MVSFFRTMNHHHVKFVWEKRWYMCCNTLILNIHVWPSVCVWSYPPDMTPDMTHTCAHKERKTHRHTHTHTHSDTQIPFQCIIVTIVSVHFDFILTEISTKECFLLVSQWPKCLGKEGFSICPSPASLASAFPLMFTWLHSLSDADCSLSLPWCWIGSPS